MLFIILTLIVAGLSSWGYIHHLPSFGPEWVPYVVYILCGLLTGILFGVLLTLFFIFIFQFQKINNKMKYILMWHYADLITIFGRVKIDVIGKENIPDLPFVVYANHKSLMDPVIVYKTVGPRIVSAVAKKSLAKIKIFGLIMREMGTILIDRENDREAMKGIIQGIKNIQTYNMGYIIFPEGGIKTRDTEEMVDVKPGCYKLATKADAKILPMSIIGSSQISKRSRFAISRVKVIIHKPILKEEYDNMTTTELGDKVFNIVNEGVKNGQSR